MPYQVLVVGAGFGGIGMAAALRQAGIDDFLVVDRADDLGGPGGTTPTPAWAATCRSTCTRIRSGRAGGAAVPAGQEILGYLRGLSAERGIDPHLRLGAGVATAEFDERRAVWQVTLEDGGTLQARAMCSPWGSSPARAAGHPGPGGFRRPRGTRPAGTTGTNSPASGWP